MRGSNHAMNFQVSDTFYLFRLFLRATLASLHYKTWCQLKYFCERRNVSFSLFLKVIKDLLHTKTANLPSLSAYIKITHRSQSLTLAIPRPTAHSACWLSLISLNTDLSHYLIHNARKEAGRGKRIGTGDILSVPWGILSTLVQPPLWEGS